MIERVSDWFNSESDRPEKYPMFKDGGMVKDPVEWHLLNVLDALWFELRAMVFKAVMTTKRWDFDIHFHFRFQAPKAEGMEDAGRYWLVQANIIDKDKIAQSVRLLSPKEGISWCSTE